MSADLAANTAAMAKKPELPKLVTWDVYRAAAGDRGMKATRT
jgi:hypothetical protein